MATIPTLGEDVDIAAGDFVDATTAGDDFVNDEDTFLLVDNQSALDKEVTVEESGSCSFAHPPVHLVHVVPAGSMWKTRRFPQGRFGSRPRVTYDGDATGIKVVAIKGGHY
jgi:hypothetical protein